MDIVNETPFPAATMIWEDLEGRAKLTVIIKTTFTFKSDTPVPADSQLPILTTDKHYDEDPLKSVRFESDMVPFKPRADVILVGRAYAPAGRPALQVDVSLTVGPLSKRLRIFSDRKWRFPSKLTLMPSISTPAFFMTMDLTYENAFGGIDHSAARFCRENLLGKGLIGKKTKESIHGKALPNVEDPRNLIKSWKSVPKPAGFGFYPRGAMPRLRFAGTYDEKHDKERAPALPRDFSYAVFNGAHPDLQLRGYLHGNEPVALVNLTPQSVARFQLPGIQPAVTVEKWSVPLDKWIEDKALTEEAVDLGAIPTTSHPLQMNLDSLVLIPDEGIFYEVFRGVCDLSSLDTEEVARIHIRG